MSNTLKTVSITVFQNSDKGKSGKTYFFTGTKLRVYDKPFDTQNYTEHLWTNHKFNSKELFHDILNLSLDTLNENYINNCVESSSGYDYSIKLESKSKTTSLKLHHYYTKEVDSFVKLLNKYLPKNHQILYLSKDNKQDCAIPN